MYSPGKRAGIIAGTVTLGALLVLFGLTLGKRLRAGPIARLAAQSQPAGIVPVPTDRSPCVRPPDRHVQRVRQYQHATNRLPVSVDSRQAYSPPPEALTDRSSEPR